MTIVIDISSEDFPDHFLIKFYSLGPAETFRFSYWKAVSKASSIEEAFYYWYDDPQFRLQV